MSSGFSCGEYFYTHAKCPECGRVRKLNLNKDWTEQDCCTKCCCPWDMYDPKRKKTATEDGA